jgi:hypothetical protein
MKKKKTKDQEQKRKPRRLRLSRETIRLLSDPALLGLARGGAETGNTCSCPGAGQTCTCQPYSEVRANCYPTTCSGTTTGTTGTGPV